MRCAVTLFVILAASTSVFSQDLKLREEAVRLLERANAVSSSSKLPNLERVDTFRVFGDSGTQDGSFTRVVVQGVGRREEYTLGSYDLVNIWSQKQVAVKGSPGILPPALVNVVRITPIYLLRFDDQDIIRDIMDRDVSGRPARCIQFDTVNAIRTDNNEICVDASSGALALEKVGQETVENSEFFSFAGALFPAKISYSFGGAQRVEIAQSMTELAASDANVLAPPPNSTMHKICTTYRRPFGVFMPQPESGNGGTTSEVLIRAQVNGDGHIYEPMVQASDRPELNAEALRLARQWTFTPAMCDGHVDVQEVDFSLHFQGR
jgi:Gram-negative bacterial TonB protein C-terminal